MQKQAYLSALALMVSSLAIATLEVGCNPQPTEGPPATERSAAAAEANTNNNNLGAEEARTINEEEVTVADITGNPNRYVGQTVTVKSDVEAAYGPNAFRLDDDAVFEGGIDNDLLVIVPPKANLVVIDDDWFTDEVIVTGTIRNFVITDIEREYDIDLVDDLEVDFKNKPVFVASSIRQVE